MYSRVPTEEPASYHHAAVVNPDGSVGVLEPMGGTAPPSSAPSTMPTTSTSSYSTHYPGGPGMPYQAHSSIPSYPGMGGAGMHAARMVVACPSCRQHLLPPLGAQVFACTCGQRMQLPPSTAVSVSLPGGHMGMFTMTTDPFAPPPGSMGYGQMPLGYHPSPSPYTSAPMTTPSTSSMPSITHVPPPIGMHSSPGAAVSRGAGGFSPPVSMASSGLTPSSGTIVSCPTCRTSMKAHTEVVVCPRCGSHVNTRT